MADTAGMIKNFNRNDFEYLSVVNGVTVSLNSYIETISVLDDKTRVFLLIDKLMLSFGTISTVIKEIIPADKNNNDEHIKKYIELTNNIGKLQTNLNKEIQNVYAVLNENLLRRD